MQVTNKEQKQNKGWLERNKTENATCLNIKHKSFFCLPFVDSSGFSAMSIEICRQASKRSISLRQETQLKQFLIALKLSLGNKLALTKNLQTS